MGKPNWKLLGLMFLVVQGVFGEEQFTLEKAIQTAFRYVRERIPDGSSAAILTITSDYPKVSEYITEELTVLAVNDGNLTIIDRHNPEGLQEKGRLLISGSFEAIGRSYLLRIRLAAAEELHGQQRFEIVQDDRLAGLIGNSAPMGNSGETSAPLPRIASEPKSEPTRLFGFPILRNYWLTIGVGWMPAFIPFIKGENLITSYQYRDYEDPAIFGLMYTSIMASVQLFDFFALQTDLIYERNESVNDTFWGSFNDNRLQFTLLAKLTLSLFNISFFEPFVGVYFTVPLGKLDYSLASRYGEEPLTGSTAYSVPPGFTAGLRISIGYFFIDYRYGFDFAPTRADNFNGTSGDLYSRSFISIGLGFQCVFIKKKSKR